MNAANINPVAILDQLLGDWASPKIRRSLHSLILLVAFAVTIWQAADGDWRKAVGAGLLALYGAANKANTLHTDLAAAGTDHEADVDDGLSYEEAGGTEFPETSPYEADDAPDDPALPLS